MNTNVSTSQLQDLCASGVPRRVIGILTNDLITFSIIIVPVIAFMVVVALALDLGRGLPGVWLLWSGCKKLVEGVLSAALMYGTYQSMRGHLVTPRNCTRHGYQFGLVALRITLAVWWRVGLWGIPLSIVLVLIDIYLTDIYLLRALFIPGIVMKCRLFVAMPIAILDGRPSPLPKSKFLTEGYKKQIFGLLLLFHFPVVIEQAVFGMTFSDIVFLSVLYAIFDMSTSIILIMCTVIIYHDLRIIKEGRNVEEIAAIFE